MKPAIKLKTALKNKSLKLVINGEMIQKIE